MQNILIVCALLGVVLVTTSMADPLDQPPENPPGWTWLIPPMPTPQGAWSQRGVMGITSHDPQGAYLLTLAWQRAAGTRYRVVVFDPQGHRHEIQEQLGAGSGDLSLAQFRVAPAVLPSEQIGAMGVEMLTPAGWQIASSLASERAKAAHIEVLPLPRLDAPYQFTLTTVDGRSIRSEELLGSVVLVDCWATWCGPCMTKMPQLRTFYEQWRTHGFEVVGINFDQEWDRAQQAVRELGLAWPQVFVPNQQEVRDLWFDVSSIRTLPRLLVLDRAGVLRLDTLNPQEMKMLIESLLARSPERK